GHPAAALHPAPDGADGRFAPVDGILPGALRGLHEGLERDRLAFLDHYGEIWAAVGGPARGGPRTRLDWGRLNQILRFADAMLAGGIPADFAEFGVWKGGGCSAGAKQWGGAGASTRRVLGFVSFQGVPAPDAQRDGMFAAGLFGDADLGEIQAFMEA